jgi:BirA family biotin operon repressor/biotin-[acetyl-CoA-carboxylase] ligase
VPGFRVEEFRQQLCTQVLGRPCHFLPEVSSTNTKARTLGQQGAAEGTIVVADAQTAGRGQAGRVWISPPERNLYVSIILRPAVAPAQAPLLSLLAAVALVDTLRQAEVPCGVKWPNDVLIGDRKVAGILTEMETDGARVHFVVVGIGVNVNMTAAELARHLGLIAPTATSVQIALGHAASREYLLAALLSHLEQWYERFCTDGETVLQAAWGGRSLMSGRRICARTAEAAWHGVVEGIDPMGRLRLRRDDGTRVTLASAEVRFLD